jgi:Trypsin-co-occurring domain 2
VSPSLSKATVRSGTRSLSWPAMIDATGLSLPIENETATRFEGLTGVRGRRTVGSGLSIWKRKIARPADRRYPLAELLTALGDELREAQRRAREDRREDVLKLKDCSVELAITWEETATGGVEFYVFKLGGELNKTNTQTISVALEPLDEVRVGRPVEIPKG